MKDKFYNISILLDSEQYQILNNSLNLFKFVNSLLGYLDNIEECEIIENKIINKLEVLEKE